MATTSAGEGDREVPIAENLENQHELDASYDGDTYDFIRGETQTIGSSIYAFRNENGRSYHAYKEGQYWGPNDQQQSEQLDIAHQAYLILFDNKLFFAPLTDPKRVLDLGTGTGTWACDFADEFPNAQVIGTDLSPIQHQAVPPNCQFEIDDATDEWTFEKDSFDYIHVRGFYGSIADWPEFYKKVLAHLKPGGYFEQVEYSVTWIADDGSVPEGHAFERWSKLFVEAGEKIGRTFRILDLQTDFIKEAGFTNVTERKFKMPVGPWSSDPKLKSVGRYHLLECYEGIEGWSMALLTRLYGWSFEQVQEFLDEVRQGFKDRSVHAYTSVTVTWAQKPS
ncbi:uncharacterized protein AB675_4998 [Cyphellophora attinorum]|uniref:S-adenosyl-L-methionine-dependent methyltransferase n=1 Tax=Cyphellophora attinorum TaxID=1664694 RepID=A0A0N0NLL5_9EURO|nr:uncharacterized protein AB675_4998 [Phialophora attinorum]KPI39318.1 hypothetical protein AB675_4998 [Phialophora attinorum]